MLDPAMVALLVEGIQEALDRIRNEFLETRIVGKPTCATIVWTSPEAEATHDSLFNLLVTIWNNCPPQNQQQRLATIAAVGLTPEQVRAAISGLAADLLLPLLPEREGLGALGRLSG